MNNRILSFDISLDSTAVVELENNVFRYHIFVNYHKFTSSKKEDVDMDEFINNHKILSLFKGFVKIHIYKRPKISVQTLGLNEWNKLQLQSVDEFAKFIFSKLAVRTDDSIIIENYSYGSDSNTTIQIVEHTSVLKNRIYQVCKDITIVPAPIVRKWLGNGNYNKRQLIEKLKEKRPNHFLCAIYDKNKDLFLKKGDKIESPLSDLVDAFFQALYKKEVIG